MFWYDAGVPVGSFQFEKHEWSSLSQIDVLPFFLLYFHYKELTI